MAWTDDFDMPSVPTYKMPTGNTNPAVPMAQRSDFYGKNKWNDPFAGFNANAEGQAQNWSNRAMSYDPMAAGGILSSPDKFNASFDFNYPDINSGKTVADIGKWGSVLDSSTAIERIMKQLAGAGVASSRGGYGGAGQEDPTVGLRRDAIQTAADQYQGNIKTAMDYMQKRAGFNQQSAGMYLDAIAKAYGITTEMAAKMMGLNLQGLTASDASGAKWRQEAYGAYDQDVGDYNRWNEGAADRSWGFKERNQKGADAQFGRDQSANDLQRYKELVSKVGKPSSSSGNAMDPADQALLEYYGTKAGAWGKPTWEPFKLSGGGVGKAAPSLKNRDAQGQSMLWGLG